MDNFAVVDLFCGVGGLTHGFECEGFNVVAGVDFDESCRFAYENNNTARFLHNDIGELSGKDLGQLFPPSKQKILMGCAPCQPFSIFNRKRGTSSSQESRERWRLLYSFGRLIEELTPEIVTMENVPLLMKFKGGKIFRDFIGRLKELGYHVSYDAFDAQYFGVPQRRKRLVVLASRLGEISMISPTHSHAQVTVRECIGDMPILKSGEVHASDPLHRSRKLTDRMLERIRATPEGGSWKDWSEELVSPCHKEESGEAYGSVYGRMEWDSVAPTITTYCLGYNNGRFGHPEQDRAISLREAALIQSFPREYDFIDPGNGFSMSRVAKQIGNAVPVGLARAIARSVKLHIQRVKP
jgi:DNA (cytosine-5)-methyltransferase 1